MKIPLDYSYAGWDIQEKHFRTHLGTLQVVSFLAFLPENASGMHFVLLYAPHDVIAVAIHCFINLLAQLSP